MFLKYQINQSTKSIFKKVYKTNDLKQFLITKIMCTKLDGKMAQWATALAAKMRA